MTGQQYVAGFLFLCSAVFAMNFFGGLRGGKILPFDGGLIADPVRRSDDPLFFRIYLLGSLLISGATLAFGLAVWLHSPGQ